MIVACQPHHLHPQLQLCFSKECISEHSTKPQVWISETTRTYPQAAFKIQLRPTEPVCELKDSASYVHFNIHFWCQ